MPATPTDPLADIKAVIARHWGFDSLRPLQAQAMQAVLDDRDSLVVLPTGGGKSLCYQAPAVCRGGTTVVVSPLIALMKDQVDGLRACGIAAAQLDSSLSNVERFAYEMDLRQGGVNLLFLSPERLVQTDLYRVLQQIGVKTFAIDEAHCISHWGHDFRPEYRQLALLRNHFPDASVHAYTATATEQVRRDIIAQLALRQPVVLVGNFDRPNLTYRVLPRHDTMKQVLDVLDRHQGEAGIIYSLRRRDVDDLAGALQKKGIKCLPYHAGMTSEQRQHAQAEFAAERCDVIVATVAFGMGIDRSNVRFVLHTDLPKSLEHYQQETGRAGRDGLEAECVLLYSGGDVMSLKSIIKKSAEEAGADPEFLASSFRHLDDMDRYARGAKCRHRALVEYFGQGFERASCAACDICLGDTEAVADSTVIAQKILSCVARVKESFGIGHVISVLRGENTENVRKRGHDQLTTYGLLKEHGKNDVRDWVYQLIGQGVLVQTEGDYPLLKLNDASWEVMRGKRDARLVQLVRRKKGEKPEKSKADEVSWEGVDHGLFEALRILRRDLAAQRQVPTYIIFSDNTLRELARIRPSTRQKMHLVYGVGEAKLREFGDRFLQLIAGYCRANGLPTDVNSAPPRAGTGLQTVPQRAPGLRLSARLAVAFDLFRQGLVVEDVMHQMSLSRSTIMDYLAQYIRGEKPASIKTWVADDLYQRVAQVARQHGLDRLKPIFIALGETVAYDTIRLVVAHLQGQADQTQQSPSQT
jgi:ATP-dependent DNA helicase RecQ